MVGLGGLGHMGVKLSHSFGAQTVLFTTSAGKVEDGKRLGADEVVISKDDKQMAKHKRSFDLIVSTVSAKISLDPYIDLLNRDGTLVLLGVPEGGYPGPDLTSALFKRASIAGSIIGGIKETQEMLDYCAEKNIVSDVEMIPIQKINEAYERTIKGDVKYRFRDRYGVAERLMPRPIPSRAAPPTVLLRHCKISKNNRRQSRSALVGF